MIPPIWVVCVNHFFPFALTSNVNLSINKVKQNFNKYAPCKEQKIDLIIRMV
jgi:hypothetical protein